MAVRPPADRPQPASIPEPVRREAIAWQVTLWSGEADRNTVQAFEQWRLADPVHEQAWQRVQLVGGPLRAAPAAAVETALRPVAGAGGRNRGDKGIDDSPREGERPATKPGRRRQLLGLGLVTISAWAVAERQALRSGWDTLAADFSTGRGERLGVTLADGSDLVLDTASAVSVRYDGLQRQLHLIAGRILVTTAVDAAGRPFSVTTGQGEVRAIGTRFSVGRFDDITEVEVAAGAVIVTPTAGAGAVEVGAGQRLRFAAGGSGPLQPLSPSALRWPEGWLVAEQRPLGELLAELARYRPGLLHWTEEVADLRVSGVFPLQDPDRVLAALAAVLPIEIGYRTRWWVTVRHRG